MNEEPNLVDYVFALLVIAVVVGLLLSAGFNILGNALRKDTCSLFGDVVACQIQRVEECLAIEKYTREECVELVGER